VARPWYRQRGLVLASLLLLFACPSAALAFGNGALAGWLGGGASSTPDLVGTIFALSTQISGNQGLSQEQVETAVYRTMAADAFEEEGGLSSINVAAPGEWTPAATPTPTTGSSGGYARQATATRTSPPPTQSGSGPTWTPTRTPTPTATEKDTDTPVPTATEVPTEVPTAVPSDTPAPTATVACDPRKTPPHPHACPSAP
jgi:hypothetical protein